MGYFSSHEQVMQEIVTEEIRAVKLFIHEMVQQAAVDCRRDLLWQRLLIGEKCDDKRKNQKQDLISRETVSNHPFSALTFGLEDYRIVYFLQGGRAFFLGIWRVA